MQEPVPGIHAEPDEQNARYFHVVVAGPEEVSFSSTIDDCHYDREMTNCSLTNSYLPLSSLRSKAACLS